MVYENFPACGGRRKRLKRLMLFEMTVKRRNLILKVGKSQVSLMLFAEVDIIVKDACLRRL